MTLPGTTSCAASASVGHHTAIEAMLFVGLLSKNAGRRTRPTIGTAFVFVAAAAAPVALVFFFIPAAA